jgi:hypothetical protein
MHLISGECRPAVVLYRLYLTWLKRCAGAAAARQTQVTKRFNPRNFRLWGKGAMALAAMSAYGPKQTRPCAPHVSAFEGKADMTFCGGPLLRSLLGVKRTWLVAAHMSAFDPKRTSAVHCGNGFEPFSALSK